jgi:hypothetical protein
MNRFLFFFVITLITCQAQSIYRSDQHLLFKEEKSSQAVLIIKDSLVYKGNSLQPKPLLHTAFLDDLKSYIPFQIGPKNYLVHGGCGPVLEWRNDSLVRIDNSFLHRNQINSVTFVYNKTIYFFGGYGLFTFKNILTKYNFITKEWDEIETNGIPPTPRSKAHGIVTGNNLYVFGGYEKDEDNFQELKDCKPIVWKLNLQSMQWSELGEYAPIKNITSKDAPVPNFTIKDKLYIIPVLQFNKVIEIDIKNNTVTTFEGITKNVFNPFFDAKTNQVVYLNKNADGLKSIMHTPLKEFLGKQVSQQAFILPWYLSLNPTVVTIVILGLLLLLILLLYINKRRSSFIPFNGITFHSTSANFYFRGKLLDTLDVSELLILEYLVQNRYRFVSLNELNHLYENEVNKNNFSTVVKRREVAFASLISKLQILTATNESDILIYQKNKEDKRIKEIKLKESFIKIK